MDVSTLPWAWWGTDLPGYRNYPTKYDPYARFDVGTLPRLPEIDPDFSWLSSAPAVPADLSISSGPTAAAAWRDLARAGVPCPPQIDRFMTTPGLAEKVPSSTACWIDLAAFRLGDAEWLILFLRDQQDSVLWLLHVAADGGHRVVLCDETAMTDWYEAGEPKPQRLGWIVRELCGVRGHV